MSVAATVPLNEYLNTTYRPDCHYLEGDLLERNVGEWDHARLQGLTFGHILENEKKLGMIAARDRAVEMRVRVQDYLDFGVPNVWVIDPKTRLPTVYTRDGAVEVSDGILTTKNPDVTIDLNPL